MSAWEGCPGASDERLCDDDGGFGLSSALSLYLDEGDLLGVAVSTYDPAPALPPFELRVFHLPLAGEGDPCGFGIAACPEALGCHFDGPHGSDLSCVVYTPPTIDEAVSYTHGQNIVTFQVSGRDTSRDAQTLWFEFLDADGDPIVVDAETGQTELTGALSEPIGRRAAFVARTRLSGRQNFPEAVGVRVLIEDEQDLRSDPVDIDFAEVPVIGDDEVCDAELVVNQCPAAFACFEVDGAPTCQDIVPPTLSGLAAHKTERFIGLRATGRDPNQDVHRLDFALFDANEQRIMIDGADAFGLQAITSEADAGNFTATFIWAAPPDVIARVESIVAVAVDDYGGVSDVQEADFRGPRDVAAGADCAPASVIERCPDRHECLEGTCQPVRAECPEGVVVRPVERAGIGRWALEGDTWSAPPLFDGSCGVNRSVAAEVVAFTAPAADTYRITVDARFDARVLVRGACGSAEPRYELFCEVGGQHEIDVELGDGEAVYVLIDGELGGDDKDAYGPWRVTVEPR